MIKRLFPNDPEVTEELQHTRPFFWLLTVVLVSYAIFMIVTEPHLQVPRTFAAFTLLMALHIGLHLASPYQIVTRRRLFAYLVTQSVLIFIISVISNNETLPGALFLALAGELIGILEDWRQATIASAIVLGLIALITTLLFDWQVAAASLRLFTPILVFILVFVILFVQQMTARAEAQQLLRELETAHNQLAAYAQQVEELTLVGERQRMARELHDTLAQGLAGLVLQLEALEGQLERGQVEQAGAIAVQAKGRARGALAGARRAIDDLRATGMESPAEAIQQEVERFTAATGIPCSSDIPLKLVLPPETAAHVVRCVSEGLANITRHAQATQVAVSVEAENGRLRVQVQDNGQGFNQETIPQGHYGLIGLRERARLAGGSLQVDSQPGQGTLVTMSIPLAKAEETAG